MKPWERSPLEIKVIESYQAEIIGEKEEEYLVEFADVDGGMVEAKLYKREFENFPHQVEIGTYFGIVVYRINGKTECGAWPCNEYWSEELKKILD